MNHSLLTCSLFPIVGLGLLEKTSKYLWQPKVSDSSYTLLSDSNLIPLLEGYLRNDSLLDMGRYLGLYDTVLRLTTYATPQPSPLLPFPFLTLIASGNMLHRVFSQHEALIPLAVSSSSSSGGSTIYGLVQKLYAISDIMLKRLPRSVIASHKERLSKKASVHSNSPETARAQRSSAPAGPSSPSKSSKSASSAEPSDEADDEITLAIEIQRAFNTMKVAADRYNDILAAEGRLADRVVEPSSTTASASESPDEEQIYETKLREHLFGDCSMVDGTSGEYHHHYKDRIKAEQVR